ncbi:MAG: hypothetical protein HOP06_08840 [Methylotenera sp.]|nr:hypothetical protein [Methylotenera sp.]
MHRFTDSIRKSIQANDWYGALSTALTLPDVCGRLEKPNSGSQARYVDWFRVWVQSKYTSEVGPNRIKRVFLHGEDCYALRCCYLHEGGSNIEMQRAQKALEDFHFITPIPGCHIHCNQSNNTLQLQVDIFCNDIADSVDQWLSSVNDDADIRKRINNLLIIHDSSEGVRF